MNAVIDDSHHARVALVGKADPAREQLRHALLARGALLVFEGDVEECVRSSLMRQPPDVLIVSLVAGVEDEIENLQPLLDDADVQVVFDDGEASSQLSGWDLDRWARHLVAKVLGAEDALPPRPAGAERVVTSLGAVPAKVEAASQTVPTPTLATQQPSVDGPVVTTELAAATFAPPPEASWAMDAPAEVMDEFDFTAAMEEAGVNLHDLSSPDSRDDEVDSQDYSSALMSGDELDVGDFDLDGLSSEGSARFEVIKTREAAAKAESALSDDPDQLMRSLKAAMGLDDHSIELPQREANRFDDAPQISGDSTVDAGDDLSDEDLLALFASPGADPVASAPVVAESSISEDDRQAWSSGSSLALEPIDEFDFAAIEPLQPAVAPEDSALPASMAASAPHRLVQPTSPPVEDWSTALLSLSAEDQALLQSVEDEWNGMDFAPIATDVPPLRDPVVAPEETVSQQIAAVDPDASVQQELARLEAEMSALMGVRTFTDEVRELEFPAEPQVPVATVESKESAEPSTPVQPIGTPRFGTLSLVGDDDPIELVGASTSPSPASKPSFNLDQFGAGLSLVPMDSPEDSVSAVAPSSHATVVPSPMASPSLSAPDAVLAEAHDAQVSTVVAGASGSLQRVIVLGASIGGPDALRTFLAGFDADFNAAFLVAQHLENGFFERLAQQLQKSTKLNVSVPQHGMRLRHGMVWVIPSDQRFALAPDGTASFSPHETPPRYRPCIDDILRSAADALGNGATAVVFSGMAADAIEGAVYLADKGGEVWVQDPETCVVSSMVDGARARGVVDFVGSPAELASHCVERFQLTLDSMVESE